MTATEITETFNYSVIDVDLASRLQRQAERIRARLRAATADVIEIGNDLLAVKESLEHGAFTLWVETECGFAIRSAENYMRVAEAEAKNANFALLPLSVAHKVAAKSTPPEIVERVLSAAEAGKPLSLAVVDDLLAAARHERNEARRQKMGLRRRGRTAPSAEALRRREREREKEIRLYEERHEKAACRLLDALGDDGCALIVDVLGDNEIHADEVRRILKRKLSEAPKG